MTILAPEAASDTESHTFEVESPDVGQRLDVYLHVRLPDHSRSYLKGLVKAGQVTVDARIVKPSHRVALAERVVANVAPRSQVVELTPQDLPIDIIHEDASLLVVNKPARLVVHPGNGRPDKTLANALAFHFQELSDVGGATRPGIVHRLDRDTTGVMVVAKTNQAHFALATQFQERTTRKEYLVLVEGEPDLDGDVVTHPLGRSIHDSSKIVVDEGAGRPAETRYEVLERFEGFAYVRCLPKTGRTHQIRVHLKSIGHPVVCDPVYGRRTRLTLSDLGAVAPGSADERTLIERQALHAHRLSIFHPVEEETVTYESPLHEDMAGLLEALRTHRRKAVRRTR